MRHVFTPESPQVQVPVKVPLNIAFTLTPPAGWRPEPGVATRLFHLRKPGGGKPKSTEVAELKVSGNGSAVVELSGFGNRQKEWREPLKFDAPADGRYSISYSGGVVTVNGVRGETHLKPSDGEDLEGLFGFNIVGGDALVPPIGWTLDFADGVEVVPPVVPPPVQPPAPPAPPVVQPVPPVTPPSGDASAALVADLKAVLLRYAAAQGVDPLLLVTLQLLLDRYGKK